MSVEIDKAGRDPADDIDHRLDAGPPPKAATAIKITVSFAQIGKFFKQLFGKKSK